MKKNLLIVAILSLSSFAVMAQTTATTDAAPVHKVKKHPIKSRLHKMKTTLKAHTSPNPPTAPKP